MKISSPKSMFSEKKQQITDPEDRSKDPKHMKKVISGFFISWMFVFHQVHGAHTDFIMHHVPEVFSTRQQTWKCQNIYETDLSAVYFIFCSRHQEYFDQKVKIISKADHSFTRRVTEIKYIAGQVEWVSALHSLLCLMIHLIFTHSFSRSEVHPLV